jgi:hypothetical protein
LHHITFHAECEAKASFTLLSNQKSRFFGGGRKGKKFNVITVRQKLTSSKKAEDFQKQTASL